MAPLAQSQGPQRPASHTGSVTGQAHMWLYAPEHRQLSGVKLKPGNRDTQPTPTNTGLTLSAMGLVCWGLGGDATGLSEELSSPYPLSSLCATNLEPDHRLPWP